ncbi:MAG: metal ABC transporter substrate-binding protein [Acidimicrobiales bacterium]
MPFPTRLTSIAALAAVSLAATTVSACGDDSTPAAPAGPTVVVTTPVLGAIVRDVVGSAATVTVLMPNGTDPHDWSPSAKDVRALRSATLVVDNGLQLEERAVKAIGKATANGVKSFTAAAHIEVRRLVEGETGQTGTATSDGHGHDDDHGDDHGGDAAGGTADPHLWLDASRMAKVARALGPALAAVGIDTADRAETTAKALDALDAEVAATIGKIPSERRKLVTGHESMGYFGERYGLRLVGAVVPSLGSQAETSAKQLAALKATIAAEKVPAIFTELGTPAATVAALARETGVRVVELGTHTMPPDGRYSTFLSGIATAIVAGLGAP